MNDEPAMNTGNINQSNMAIGDNVQQTLNINITN